MPRASFTVVADPDTQFAPDALDHMIGTTIPYSYASGPGCTARIVDVAVALNGQTAQLTLEVPDA